MDKKITALLKIGEDVKILLILVLLKQGISQVDIAKALGITQSTVSKYFPGGLRVKTKKRK